MSGSTSTSLRLFDAYLSVGCLVLANLWKEIITPCNRYFGFDSILRSIAYAQN